MGRFRYSGTNWEGRRWRVSAAIEALGRRVEAAWPVGHPVDGTVASRAHDAANPRSDHRPRPFSGSGIVRAIDVGETVENQGARLAEELRASRDPRIKYVIHEARLFSSYDHSAGRAWSWRPYRGGNEHLNHVHISVVTGADSRGGPWAITLEDDMAALQVIDLQKALNQAGVTDHEGKRLAEDDKYGPRTHSALVKGLAAAPALKGVRIAGTFSGTVQ